MIINKTRYRMVKDIEVGMSFIFDGEVYSKINDGYIRFGFLDGYMNPIYTTIENPPIGQSDDDNFIYTNTIVEIVNIKFKFGDGKSNGKITWDGDIYLAIGDRYLRNGRLIDDIDGENVCVDVIVEDY